MIDVDALLDQMARRDRALNAGSTHIPLALRTTSGPLPEAESPNDRPLLEWPSERHLAPRRCHRCRSTALETDEPYGLVRHGETRCMLCSRVVVRWRADNTERAPLAPLTDDELHPRRGRPPKATEGAPPRMGRPPGTGRSLCPECLTRSARVDRSRCRACAAARAGRVAP